MKPPETPPAPPFEAPSGYEWVEHLGRGGMGDVWLAVEPALDRVVALKFLAPEHAADAAIAERFAREAALAARLQHPHIVTIHRVGTHLGRPFIAMRHYGGGDLAARQRRRAGSVRESVGLVAQLARALDHAHREGVLHRDVKPGNVLLDDAGAPVLSDFGLAAEIEAAAITRLGAAAGTPQYLAPELWRASLDSAGANGQLRAASPATDRYALAVLLYELLLGKPPFAGASATELPILAQREPPAPLHLLDRTIPPDVSAICLKGLEKDPARRYASGEEFAQDLEAFLAGKTVTAQLPSAGVRLRRWARAQPVLSTALAATALALVGVTVAAVIVSQRIARERDQARAATVRAEAAEGEARHRLRGSLLERARATRLTGRVGQRFASLAALREAAAISPGSDLRDEAVAALALPDWRATESRECWSGTARSATPAPDGSQVLVEFTERRFALYDCTSPARRPARWEITAPDASAGLSVWSPDGRRIALQLRNDDVVVLDATNGAIVHRWPGFAYAFRGQVAWYGQAMDFSPDSTRLALASPGGEIVVFQLSDGAEVMRGAAGGWMTNVRFSPDGTRLAVGGTKEPTQNRVAVLEAASGRELAAQPMPGRVDLLAWSPDARALAVRAAGQGTEIRRASDLALTATLPDRQALTAHFAPGGGEVFLTEQTGFTRRWEIATARLLVQKSDGGRPGCWYRDLGDGTVEQWRATSGGELLRSVFEPSPAMQEIPLRPGTATISQSYECFELAPDGRTAVAAGSGAVVLLQWPSGEILQRAPVGDGSGMITVKFSPDASALWVGCNHTGLWRMPLSSDAGGRLHAGDPGLVEAGAGFVLVAVSRDGARAALTNTELPQDNVRVIDLATRKRLAAWSHARASGAAFSPDATLLAVNALAGGAPAVVYEAISGAVRHPLGGGAGAFVRWSPEGRWILAAQDAGRSVLVRTDTWAMAHELAEGAGGDAMRAEFSPDGNWIATKRRDGRFELFATERSHERGVILPPAEFGSWTNAVRFSPDGAQVIFVHIQPRLVVWDRAALARELGALGLGYDAAAR